MTSREDQSPHVVNLAKIRLEPNVKMAFETAWALSDGTVLTAGNVLSAVLEVSDSAKSQAFAAFKSLLRTKNDFPLSDGKTVTQLDFAMSPLDYEKLPLAPAFAASFERLEPFLQKSGSMWGRDLITIALLAQEDAGLQAFALALGTPLETLRSQWFNFVYTTPSHRDAREWRRWWEASGAAIPPPDEDSPDQNTAFLLPWDPERHSFETIHENGTVLIENPVLLFSKIMALSFVSSPSVRVWVIKKGGQPGLAGAGFLRFDPMQSMQIKQSKAPERVSPPPSIQWDYLFETPVLDMDALIDITEDKSLWASIDDVVPIHGEVVRKLDIAAGQALADHQIVLPRAYIQPDAPPAFGSRGAGTAAQDSLDVRRQAEIFATLLVAQYSRPPFAIGLLGDWGVGKTFFMRLMQEAVGKLIAGGTPSANNANAVSRVAQIEFNAWHYVDSDLWASLASHIFDELSKELSDTPDEVLEVRRKLRSEIHSSTREKQEAEAAIENARTEREAAGASLSEKQAEHSQLAGRLDKQRLKRIWQAVLAVKPDKTDPQRRDWPDIAALKANVEATAKKLGIDHVIDNAERLEQVYGQMRDLCRRGSTFAMAIADDFTGRNLGRSIPICMALIGFVLLLQFLPDWLALHNTAIRQWLAPLVQASTLGVSLAAWIAKRIKPIVSAVSWLEQIRQEVKKPRIDPPEPDAQESRLIRKLEALDADITKQQQRIIEADRQISKAQAEIQRINAGGLVYDFLEGRVRDGRYLDRLGLISVIRQDFEQLGKLLKDWSTHYTPDNAFQQPDVPTSNNNPIERIVLYIDDLDRCAPSRVVEVLQAVHLLLAFDLFIVIVAVDARWLERSLNETYNPALASKGGAPVYQSRHKFSAHNYLEKIFQIPFNLPVMQPNGFTALIDDMIASPRQARTTAAPPAPEPQPKEIEPAADPKKENTTTQADRTADSSKTDPTGRSDGQPASTGDATEEKLKKRAAEQARKMIEAMLLSNHEKQFIHALYPFIPTPRLAKRFINIYRLLRVRATAVEETFSHFINAENGSYRAVLLLLAICVGKAETASHLIRQLCNTTSTQPFSRWLDSLADETGPAATAQLLISPAIQTVRNNLQEIGPLTIDENLDHYRAWGAEVGRYSFRWERLSPGTAQTGTNASTAMQKKQ